MELYNPGIKIFSIKVYISRSALKNVVDISNGFLRGLKLEFYISEKKVMYFIYKREKLPIWKSYISYIKLLGQHL